MNLQESWWQITCMFMLGGVFFHPQGFKGEQNPKNLRSTFTAGRPTQPPY